MLLESPEIIVLFGVVFAPLICIGTLITSIVLFFRYCEPTYSSSLFLGLSLISIPVFLFISPNAIGPINRIVILLALSAVACILETIYRRLPHWHGGIAGMSVVFTLSYGLMSFAIAVVMCE